LTLIVSHFAEPDKPSFEHLLGQLGDSGQDFERIAKWFLEHDPDYGALFRHVWLWKDWPGRWGIDKGIDLIAETFDGGLIAIQAKNYDEQHWISKRDIDTFLSESGRAMISERLLIGTTDRVASTALEVMSAQEKPVSRCLRSRLASALVQWPASPHDLDSGHRHPAKTPRPDQEEALIAIEDGLRLHDRGKVIMACGTGKTLIALWAAERSNSELTLVLVPSLWLLRQTAQEWAASAQQSARTLKVCSERGGSEDTPALIDVADIGPGVTTDPEVIRAFLTGAGPRVVFATYQSSPQIAKAMAHDCAASFDLAICDEAHWCAGLAGKGNKTILHEEKIRARKRLFFTATPTIYPPHEIVRVAQKRMTVVSMSDTRMFGPELYRLSFADAIDRGLLCPYQVVRCQ
jgi:predicted helicase